MAVDNNNNKEQQRTEWAPPRHRDNEWGPRPALWEKETLQSLALFAVVSFGLIAYVLLVVKKKKTKKLLSSKDKQA
jgi:hypothetical protein